MASGLQTESSVLASLHLKVTCYGVTLASAFGLVRLYNGVAVLCDNAIVFQGTISAALNQLES